MQQLTLISEFDTREEALEAARKCLGGEVGRNAMMSDNAGHDVFKSENGWINDLNCRFEVNFYDGRKSENFWVKEKFTAEEIRGYLTQAWIQLEGVRSVGAAVAESLLDDAAKGTIGRILAAKEDEANSVIRQFVPKELLRD
jgi:hypothetical protein